MADTPDHMAGMNALPSMRDYNAALANARATQGTGRTVEQSRALSQQIEALREQAMRDKYGPAKMLSRDLSKELNQSINDKLRKQAMAAPKGSTIKANQDSECFESLIWKDGVVTATFYHGGAIVYDYDMSKSEFLDWAFSDSLGSFFNGNVR